MASESLGAETAYRFEAVSDADLLTSTRRLVGRSNRVLAALLYVHGGVDGMVDVDV